MSEIMANIRHNYSDWLLYELDMIFTRKLMRISNRSIILMKIHFITGGIVVED